MGTLAFTRAIIVLVDHFDFLTITSGAELDLIWEEGSSLDIMRHTRRGNTNITFMEGSTLSVDTISLTK